MQRDDRGLLIAKENHPFFSDKLIKYTRPGGKYTITNLNVCRLRPSVTDEFDFINPAVCFIFCRLVSAIFMFTPKPLLSSKSSANLLLSLYEVSLTESPIFEK